MSGRLLLDTNTVVLSWKREEGPIAAIAAADEIYIPAPVVGELIYGAFNSDRLESDLARIRRFIGRSPILPCDEQVAYHYGQIKAALRKKGRPIPENDIWIAAIALQHDLTLVTHDAHFDQIEQLPIVRWE